MADPCKGIIGEAKEYCRRGVEGGVPDTGRSGGGITGGASEHVKDLAESLIAGLKGLLAPESLWAPKGAAGFYEPFLWLGQHLAVAIFTCVVVVCGLTAWRGVPRLKQMGMSVGWTLAAVAAMASVPGVVTLLNKALSSAFTAAFNSNESTLLGSVSNELENGPDAGNPLLTMIITAALCVALLFATVVYTTRQIGILLFVCAAPVVLASLAREGDTSAVKVWFQRLLGLMFAPFALLVLTPFVSLAKGSLLLHTILFLAADLLMLRMIVHGVPYVGPRVAGFARTVVYRKTDNEAIRRVVRLGAPEYYERENAPRGLNTVDTPGRAVGKDKNVLFGAFGARSTERPGRMTTDSVIAQTQQDADRTARLAQARRQARSAQSQATGARGPASGVRPRTPGPRPPATAPTPAPGPGAGGPSTP